MRYAAIEYLKSVLDKHPPINPVVEIGSRRIKIRGLRDIGDIRSFFNGMCFMGCDQNPGLGVDLIQNVEHLTFGDEEIGTIVCLDTLHCIRDMNQSMREIYRVLKPKGLVIITTVLKWKISDYNDFSSVIAEDPAYYTDYWRLTPYGLGMLLKPFSESKITIEGWSKFPVGVYGYGIK